MAKIDTESNTITFGLKELITSALAIIFAMLGLFYTFYNMAVSNMTEKYEISVKTMDKLQTDIDQTSGDVSDVRDMQIKLNTYLEIILKQTIDKKTPVGETSGGNGSTQ